jgi:hypothetical protein
MKLNKTKAVALSATIAAATMGVVRLYAQSSSNSEPGLPPGFNRTTVEYPSYNNPPTPYPTQAYPSPNYPLLGGPPNVQWENPPSPNPSNPDANRLPPEMRKALETFRSPDSDDDEKKNAKETLRDYLKEVFEKDQKVRREHISKLEEQLARLKKQNEKREQSQEKLIDLRLQLLENESEGLSFPDSWSTLQSFGQFGQAVPNQSWGRVTPNPTVNGGWPGALPPLATRPAEYWIENGERKMVPRYSPSQDSAPANPNRTRSETLPPGKSPR